MTQSRTFGYVLASSDDQVESAEHQRQIIDRYCGRLARRVDGMYVDRVGSENQRLFDREAGRQLQLTLRRGDHVIVARLDRLDRSFKGFTRVLHAWSERGVVSHLCDMPLTVLDPEHRNCDVFIKLIVKFAEHERRMIGQRTSQGLAVVKSEGRRYSRNAPIGFAWEQRGKSDGHGSSAQGAGDLRQGCRAESSRSLDRPNPAALGLQAEGQESERSGVQQLRGPSTSDSRSTVAECRSTPGRLIVPGVAAEPHHAVDPAPW